MMLKNMKVKYKFIKAALVIFKTSVSALVHMLKILLRYPTYLNMRCVKAEASSCKVKV